MNKWANREWLSAARNSALMLRGVINRRGEAFKKLVCVRQGASLEGSGEELSKQGKASAKALRSAGVFEGK